jgi:MerR family transcriptional regulator, copper efflux regulator
MRPMLYLQVDMKASPSGESFSWTVGELADRVGVATHVLRHWEDVGLLSPGRDASGYRRYGRDDLVRVLTIRSSQVAGMSLDQIGALLDVDSAARHEVLETHLARLEEQRRELDRSRLMTEHALRCRSHDVAQCPRFRSFVEDLVEGAVRPGPGEYGLPGPERALRPPRPGGRRSG